MKNTDNLFKETTCYINKKKVKGKVLTIAKKTDSVRVCFRPEGEHWGIWVSSEALFNIESELKEIDDKIKNKV